MGGLAGTVGSMVGIGGSAAAQGMNWAPGQTGIDMPVTSQQAKDAGTAAQTGIANQASFLSALQAQNGIGNQSQVYNQLQGVANGTGPNPAQAQLAQATGANTANQAALMAGQRGAGSNVGLIAREAAQQGGANQQQAAGQAATMQAQQSLGALNQLGGIAGQQVGQQAAATGALTGAQQSEQQLLLGQINAQNAAGLAQQQGLNTLNAGQAAQGAKAQAGFLQGAGSLIGMAQGGRVYANSGWSQVGPSESVSSMPVDQSHNYTIPPEQPSSAPAAPSAPPSPLKKSGQAPATATNAQPKGQQPDPLNSSGQTLGSGFAKGVSGLGNAIKGLFSSSSSPDDPGIPQSGYNPAAADIPGGNMAAPAMSADFEANAGGGPGMAHGGKVPAMVSPGERYLPPSEVEKVAKGKKEAATAGEKIPGKAKVKGDSLKNDTVPKTLEEGGIVLPKSVMEAKHPHWEAHKFVSAILAKQGLRGKRA